MTVRRGVGVLLVVLLVAASLAVRAAVEVTVVADGEQRRVRTFAATVAEVLDRVAVEVADADVVTPSLTTPVSPGLAIEVTRAVTVTVSVDGAQQQVTAVVDHVAEVLALAGIDDPGPAALRVEPPRDTPVSDGSRVEAVWATPVTVVADGAARRLLTFATDVAGVLSDAAVVLGDDDRVSPPLETRIAGPTTIGVARVTRTAVVEEVLLGYDEERRSSDEYAVGVTRVVTAGSPGLVQREVALTLVDGVVSERQVLDEQVVREPVAEVVVEGTYEPPPAGTAGGRVVHLTFDDGPNPAHTPAILDLLARYDAEAVFFVIGNAVAAHPELARRIVAEGHRLGNHSWSHPSLAGRSRGFVEDQLLRTQRAVGEAAGVRPSCLRPPYGDSDANLLRWSGELGLQVVRWSVDPFDWRDPGARTIAARVLADTGPGSVVLLHDGPRDRAQTVDALALVLAELSDRGYRFTAVPGC